MQKMTIQLTQLYRNLVSLTFYRSVLEDQLGQATLALLRSLRQALTNGDSWDTEDAVLQAYRDWFGAIALRQLSWEEHLRQRILTADNGLTRLLQKQSCDRLAESTRLAAQRDLRILQALAAIDSATWITWIQQALTEPIEVPVWSYASDTLATPEILAPGSDWASQLEALAAYYRQHGTGLFAEYRAFGWQDDRLVGIAHPDPISVENLIGYEWQRDALLKNTQALIAGYPALHVLLYGSRGAGKSSLVKSLLQSFGDRGLRLVEVSKSQLTHLPKIVEQLREVPQKFIVFVDDLSFEEDDDAYKALKVVLEGNVTARSQNVVVYATSNRRHLIREFYGDRPRPKDADEIHQWDTVQEKLSFSDRFGLTLTFEPADQPTYLQIVHHLAQQAGIQIASEDLDFRALQWATRHNGRSGRTARQFVDFLTADLAMQAESFQS